MEEAVFYRGRLTLIQIVLSSLPTYNEALFWVPKRVFKIVNKIMGNFGGEESGEFKKHLIICWVLCKNQKKRRPSNCVFSAETQQYSLSGPGGSLFSV